MDFKLVGVHKGGDGGWAHPTVLMHIEMAWVASIFGPFPGVLQPSQWNSSLPYKSLLVNGLDV
ncbi:unnamed protein product, partial [Vitis vinifera]